MGQVVNGGLIDFQDNFHRGLAEYASYMQHQQQQTLMSGFPGQSQPQQLQQQLMASGYPAQLQQAFQQQPQQQMPMGVSAGGAGTTHLPCISGPPSYVHINGQTYVPVDSSSPAQISSSVPAVKQAAVEASSASAEPAQASRTLSNEDIDRRVHEQVEAWASRQRKPISYQQHESYSDAAPPSSRQHLKGRAVSDEDRAAERVSSVNAGMRGRVFRSPF